MMNRVPFFLCLSLAVSTGTADAVDRPNVVFILADDKCDIPPTEWTKTLHFQWILHDICLMQIASNSD